MCINGIFYVDNQTDTSQANAILNWIRLNSSDDDKNSNRIGRSKQNSSCKYNSDRIYNVDAGVKSMHNTSINSLSLKIGEDYLYLHHQRCEHRIFVVDVSSNRSRKRKSISNSSDIDYKKYPMETYKRSSRIVRCWVCSTFNAKYITFGDRLTEVSPTYFCE